MGEAGARPALSRSCIRTDASGSQNARLCRDPIDHRVADGVLPGDVKDSGACCCQWSMTQPFDCPRR
jgi:hypothetical protein